MFAGESLTQKTEHTKHVQHRPPVAEAVLVQRATRRGELREVPTAKEHMSKSPQPTGSAAHTRRITVAKPGKEHLDLDQAVSTERSEMLRPPFWNVLPSSPNQTGPARNEPIAYHPLPSTPIVVSLSPAAARRLGSHPRRSYHGQPSSAPLPRPISV